MYKLLFGLVALLAVALGLVIGTLNPEPVHLDLLWVQFHWPLGLVLLLTLTVGLLLGLLLLWLLQVLPLRIALRRARSTAPAVAPSTPESDDV